MEKVIENIIEYVNGQKEMYIEGKKNVREEMRKENREDYYNELEYELGRINEALSVLEGVNSKIKHFVEEKELIDIISTHKNQTNLSNSTEYSNQSITGNDITITYEIK